MLPKQFRLKRCSLFSKTMASGKTLCNTPYFLVLALPRIFTSSVPTRFGFIVSKKVSNKAVKRNKVKRRLREMVRNNIIPREWPQLNSYITIIFIARRGILEASYNQIQTALMKCLETT